MSEAKRLSCPRNRAHQRLDWDAESERPWSTPGADQGPEPLRAASSREPELKGADRPNGGPPRRDRRDGAPSARGGSNRLLTVEEVAAWLRVSEHTLRNNYRSWGLKPQKVGRLLRFRERDVTHYLDEHYG